MPVIGRASANSSGGGTPTASPTLYILAGLLICLCLGAPVIWLTQRQRGKAYASLREQVETGAQLRQRQESANSKLSQDLKAARNAEKAGKAKLAAEKSFTQSLSTTKTELEAAQRETQRLLDEAQEESRSFREIAETRKTEVAQQQEAAIELQTEILALEDQLRVKNDRVQTLERKFEFVNQQFLASQANSPVSTPAQTELSRG